MSAKRFRVALSFAGEKREFVAKVADILARRFGETAILYDKYHEAEFAHVNLAFTLPDLYRGDSDLIVAVFCPDYETKEWCGLEWRAIFALVKEGIEKPIMLARFAHADGKGLHGLAGFIELDHKTPEQTATLILERLALNENHPKDHYTKTTSARALVHKASINNLPRLPTFFGRQVELDTIAKALLPQTRTWGALIDGPGGMGKTSLAIRAAEIAAPEFDRVLFVSTKAQKLTPDGTVALSNSIVPAYAEMLSHIASLFGLPHLADRPEPERPALIKAAIQAEKVLLILDNLENLDKAQQNLLFEFVSDLPASCKAIVTSRRRTDVDARIIRLGKLDRDAALAFLDELSAGRDLLARASREERLHLYEETGGNPLLLRWVVGQLGRGNCRSIAGALELCRKASAVNDPLEFIFGDLLETFTDAETKVLAALTYFTQKIEIRFAAELASLSQTAAETALGDLANRALVIPDETEEAFALVPMVADFLRNKRPEVIKETGSRLKQRAYAVIVQNGYQKFDSFPVLEAAWPGIAPALPLFLTGENARLQTICDALHNFLDSQGRWDESLALFEKAEGKAIAAADHQNAGWCAYYTGIVHQNRQQAALVLTCATRATAHWQLANADARKRAIAISLRAAGHQLNEDYPAAIAAFREVLELHLGLAAVSEDVAIALNDLACAERFSGDLKAAERHYREGLRVARDVGNAEIVANYVGNLAGVALDRKEWTKAEALAREALPLAEAVHRQELIAGDCISLAQALVNQKRFAEAQPFAQRAANIFTRLESPDLVEAQAILAEVKASSK